MADPDPLAPSSAPPSPGSLMRPSGQVGLDPYSGLFAGLSAGQLQAYNLLTDPLFQYTFGPQMPPPDQPELADPEHGMYPEFAGIQANFDPTLQGNVEFGQPLDDPLMAQLQSSLAFQSTGFAPQIGNTPTTAPWVTAAQPGVLEGQAGFGDIGSAPNLSH